LPVPKPIPLQIRWGADFGAAKLAVCKRRWGRPGAAALHRAVLKEKLNIKLSLIPHLKLCWKEGQGNKKRLLKLEAIKPLLSSGFAGLLKRKQFIFGINKWEKDRLGMESPTFTPGELVVLQLLPLLPRGPQVVGDC